MYSVSYYKTWLDDSVIQVSYLLGFPPLDIPRDLVEDQCVGLTSLSSRS